jgi:hypothetical protein
MSRPICLKCTQCRTNLSGENNSKVFFCHTCALGFNVDTALGKLLQYPLLYIKPGGTGETEQVYFPFWQFESRYTLDGSVPTDSSCTRTFYVPAFFIKNINYFGDIGFFYMKHKVVWSRDRGARSRFSRRTGISVMRRGTQVYLAKNYPLLRDMRKGFPEVQVKHLKAGVILVPFTNRAFLCGFHTFWKYPSGALI